MKTVSVDIFKEKVQSPTDGVLCIDVRSQNEYDREHINGVVNVPLSEIHTHGGVFRNKKEVYVHCQSGGRSVIACETLSRLFPHVLFYNVDGGILAWKGAALPTVS